MWGAPVSKTTGQPGVGLVPTGGSLSLKSPGVGQGSMQTKVLAWVLGKVLC